MFVNDELKPMHVAKILNIEEWLPYYHMSLLICSGSISMIMYVPIIPYWPVVSPTFLMTIFDPVAVVSLLS